MRQRNVPLALLLSRVTLEVGSAISRAAPWQCPRMRLPSLPTAAIAFLGLSPFLAACGGALAPSDAANDDSDSGRSILSADASAVAPTDDAAPNAPDVNVPFTLDATGPCPTGLTVFSFDPPDAAIGTSGASMGTCLACIYGAAACKAPLAQCNDDCTCALFAGCVFKSPDNCLGANANGCVCLGGASLLKVPPETAEAPLAECLLGSCATACGLPR
jgi:hypothetical protein